MTHVRRPAQSVRVGIVRGAAIVHHWHVEVSAPLAVGLTGREEDGAVELLPTEHGPLLRVAPGLSGRLGRGGKVGPLAAESVEVGRTWGLLLRVGDRVRVGLPGGAVLLQGMPEPVVAPVEPGGFRPVLVAQDDRPFLGVLSSCASAAMALLVVAAGIEPVDSLAHFEPPERIVQVLVRPPVPPEPPEAPAPPEPESDAPASARPAKLEEPSPTPEDPPRVGRKPLGERLRHRAAVVGRLDQISSVLASVGDDGELMAALDRTGQAEPIASKGGGGLRAAVGGDGRRDASVGLLGRGGSGGSEARHQGVASTVPHRPRMTIAPLPSADEATGIVELVRQRYARRLQNCYQRRVNANPSLRGRVELSFDVEGGIVSFVAVSENGTGDEALADCIEARAGQWRFADDASGSFQIPLVFEVD